ncbi:MAG: FAD-binding protein, partial [bacterium]|nr:FAD-binding protein [bacterium]
TIPEFDKPLTVSLKDKSFHWDEEHDVVVIGFGGSGTAAAIEAVDNGADVLAIDRFTGGGATRMSGGVMYVGGGTNLQKDAGYDDTPEEMFKYLKCEIEDAVTDKELKNYCKKSLSNFKWIESFGVPYPPSFESVKTSYPGDAMTLYFSGNEILPPYCDKAKPAPRGHRALGKAMTGNVLYDPLRKAAIDKGVEISYRTRPK